MPLYVYECEHCDKQWEELQKSGEAPPKCPTDASECPHATEGSSILCRPRRVLTAARHRFTPDYTSDGIGGYTRQGDAMVRQVKGKNSDRYGLDRGGHG